MEKGLFCDDLVLDETVKEDKAVHAEGTVVVGKVITYHPQTETGEPLFGSSKVSVRISAVGQVTEWIYNHIHYEHKATLSLMGPEEAFEQASAQKEPTAIYFEAFDEVPAKLAVKSVRVAYYENVMAEVPSRQPVYILEGGSGEGQFAISVSALRRE